MDYHRGDPHHPYHHHDRGGGHPDRNNRGGGRGRGISNAPAWMTAENDNYGRENMDHHPHPHHHPSYPPSRRPPPPPHPNHRRRNNNGGNRSGIYFNSLAEERAWVEDRRRKRRERKPLFDVLPQDSLSKTLQDYTPQPQTQPEPGISQGFNNNGGNLSQPQQTRHARRLYIGHLPVELSEQEVHEFFRTAIRTAMDDKQPEEDPILSVYINVDRRFAFVEFKTMEICTACLALDGINVCGKGKVKIKRPNDYNAALAPPVSQLPDFDVSKLGIVSGTVPDGSDKIFIGGLPYHLTDDQVMELLGAFGKVKAFHLVKADPTASTSKGYCFVEYAQGQQVTPVAVMGLNGMDMGGGKILSARIAASKSDTPDEPFNVMPSMPADQFVTSIPQPIPTINVVNGIDVNLLLDAAMGLRPMPTLEALLMEQHQNPVTTIVSASITPPPLPMPQLQTRVLVLLNMVTENDFATDEDYNGLVEDVKTECEKFGKLKSYKIPKPGDAHAPSAINKIFLEYETLQDSIQAEQGLAGRSFGPAFVEATYFDEQQYAAGDLL